MVSQPRFLVFPSVFNLTFPPWVDALTAMSGSSASRRYFEFVNATWKSQADFFKFQSGRRACADRDRVPLIPVFLHLWNWVRDDTGVFFATFWYLRIYWHLFSLFVLDGQIFSMELIAIDYFLTLLLIYRIQEVAKSFQTVCSKEKKSRNKQEL